MRVGTKVRVLANEASPTIEGQVGVVIWRRARKWVRVRIDSHAQPFGPQNKGWFLPLHAIERVPQ